MINAYIFIYSTLCSIVVVRDFFFLSGRPYSFKTNDILSFSHNVHIDESHLDNVLSTLLYTSKSSMRRYFMVRNLDNYKILPHLIFLIVILNFVWNIIYSKSTFEVF